MCVSSMIFRITCLSDHFYLFFCKCLCIIVDVSLNYLWFRIFITLSDCNTNWFYESQFVTKLLICYPHITGSYGSTLRYKSVERMKPIGKHSLLGASGEISDFQEILRYLDELM